MTPYATLLPSRTKRVRVDVPHWAMAEFLAFLGEGNRVVVNYGEFVRRMGLISKAHKGVLEELVEDIPKIKRGEARIFIWYE